ncbi:MAG: polysaccharide pyruvyl transferase family protein [Clostridia bacterium]|nr:polysaccharide pyruvyl transferase family protein [Clostridia bacterium]
MKINTKTVTFHSAINYGAILQTIALQAVIQNNGYNNMVIDYNDRCMDVYKPLYLNVKGLKNKVIKVIKFFLFGKRINKKNKIFERFIADNIILTPKIKNIEQLNSIVNSNDTLITGSDQVWNTDFFEDVPDVYTLNFGTADNKRISYAASIGQDSIDEKYQEDFINKISRLRHISVREETAKQLLQTLGINNNIEVTADPTMLLTKDEWTHLIRAYDSKEKEKYILAYTMDLNKEYIDIANYMSQITGYKIIYLDMRNLGFKNVLRNAFYDNPYEFINLIKNAEYVITNSFHGTVFSIIFNKKFWNIPHRTRGSRMIDMLKKFNLSQRLVTTLDDFKKKNYDENIDYDAVNKILENERKSSIDYLINAIDN